MSLIRWQLDSLGPDAVRNGMLKMKSVIRLMWMIADGDLADIRTRDRAYEIAQNCDPGMFERDREKLFSGLFRNGR
ncbi:MAG TPA: hypothetical protein VKT73_12965 [Xanthobacteraceae bacterium]|nr:hypothetical protein [Xanthobacteraceae bacterium]